MKTLRGILGALVLLSATALLADEPIEIGQQVSIHSKILDEDRVVYVRLPEGFSDSSRHPVLYLTDARAQFIHTAATVRFLARNGLMPEMIVVGITNTERTRDLTPTRADRVQADGSVRELPTSGGADRFLDFIEKELVPLVDERYHPQPYRVFAGHSFGGLLAVHAFVNRPQLFGACVAVSPSLTWDGSLVIRQARDYLSKQERLDKALVVTVGGDENPDMKDGVAAFEKVLAEEAPDGLVFAVKTLEGDDHGSVVLGSHLFGLRKVFEGWRPPLDPATGRALGGLEALTAHFARISERLGYEVLPPEALVNQQGYLAMQAGDMDAAIAVFEWNVAHYPGSANVYDSLGEGLQAAGRLLEALSAFQKAVRLGEETDDPNLGFYREHLKAVEEAL